MSGSNRYGDGPEIGVGGMGRVVRAFDRHLRRSVARKSALYDDGASRDRLLHEARLLAYLDHPGAVTVYDVDPETGAYSMKLLSGDTLSRRLQELGDVRLPIREVVRIIRRISETMANAHDKGVLHLDLKPSNIILGRRSEVTVIDWGLARFHDRTQYEAEMQAASEQLDLTGEVPVLRAGTLAYMPVEQMLEPDRVGPGADIYAVGTMLYEMLTGELPFRTAGTHLQVAFRKAQEIPPTPSSMCADAPASLDALCMRMLAPEPADRPRSFDEVLRELDGLPMGSVALDPISLGIGEHLCTAGDPGGYAWQILSGRVVVVLDGEQGEQVIAERGVGDVIGEMSLLSGQPRSATVRALEPTTARPIRASDVESELAKVHPLVAHMVRSMSDRLREMLPGTVEDA